MLCCLADESSRADINRRLSIDPAREHRIVSCPEVLPFVVCGGHCISMKCNYGNGEASPTVRKRLVSEHGGQEVRRSFRDELVCEKIPISLYRLKGRYRWENDVPATIRVFRRYVIREQIAKSRV
jgi:hypothetical protein